MNTAERRATAALWSVQGLGPVTLGEVRKHAGPLGELLSLPVASWAPLVPWRANMAERVGALGSLAARADWLEQRCRRDRVQILFPGDAGFPARLEGIEKAPALLFARGPVGEGLPRRKLAIVGTRQLRPELCQRVHDIAAEAAMAGLCIVSGAADGTDRSAHLGALQAEGDTWAFMGAALDQLDEAQRVLGGQILAHGGSILSEYPPGFRANTNSFTLRNRLISGASDAVLIFRAGRGSGALHTAEAALKQGRPLLCSPGPAWEDGCKGTNDLLRRGEARVHLDLDDLIGAVGLSGAITEVGHVPMDLSGLTEPSKQVLAALRNDSDDFEGLQERLTGFSSGQLSACLTELELFGAVVHKGGRRYEKR